MISSAILAATELFGLFLGFILFSLVAILIHEVGHIATGLAAGFRVVGVRVGPLQYQNKKWQWRASRINLSSGSVLAQFRRLPSRWAALQCLFLMIGGPCANLLAACILWKYSDDTTLLGPVTGFLSFACVGIGVASLIPMKTRIGYSDGMKLAWLIFVPKKRQELILLHSISTRMEEIKTLLRECRLNEAMDKVDNLICGSKSASLVHVEWVERLAKLRGAIESRLAGHPSAAEAPRS
jgi:hypothetical protein